MDLESEREPHLRVVVRMRVDDAGREDEPLPVHAPLRGADVRADRHDAPIPHRQLGALERRSSGAIYDGCAADDQIVHALQLGGDRRGEALMAARPEVAEQVLEPGRPRSRHPEHRRLALSAAQGLKPRHARRAQPRKANMQLLLALLAQRRRVALPG